MRDKRFIHKKNRDNSLKMLKHVIDILNKHKIEYYLDFGTLLGAMRDNALIPWDDDLDISLVHQEDYSKIENILNKIREEYNYRNYLLTIQQPVSFTSSNSFRIAKLRSNMFWKFGRGKTTLDIFFKYKYKEQLYWISNEEINRVPANFLNQGLMEIDFYNIRCKVPVNFDAYLTSRYGNWRVEDKTWTEAISITKV